MRNYFGTIVVLFVLTSSLMAQDPNAHWPMDVRDNPSADKTPDIIGENHATLYPSGGPPPVFSEGVTGNAVWLSNSTTGDPNVDQYIRVDNFVDEELSIGTGDATWTWWYRKEDAPINGETPWIESLPNAVGTKGYTIYHREVSPNEGIDMYIIDSPPVSTKSDWGNFMFTVGQWYHLAVVRDYDENAETDTYTLYIDGEVAGVPSVQTGQSDPLEIDELGSDIWIGKRKPDVWGQEFEINGGIDDVRIFFEPLSQAEVKSVMFEGRVDIVETDGDTLVNEDGLTDTFNLVLLNPPTGRVIFEPTYDTSQVQLSPEILTFNLAGPNSIEVTVSAVNDAIAEGFHNSTVTYNSINDPNFSDYDLTYLDSSTTLTVDIVDNDIADFSIIESGDSTDLDESGDPNEDTYEVVLGFQPKGEIRIAITTDGQTTVDPVELIFQPGDWFVPQTVSVSVIDDGDSEGPHISTITNLAKGGAYEGISKDVLANVTDNERYCGDGGHEYYLMDVNRDCYVDMTDFSLMTSDWLKCSHPFYPEVCNADAND